MRKLTIRQEASKITGYTFTSNKYRDIFATLQKEGRLSIKEVIDILAVLMERESERENDL